MSVMRFSELLARLAGRAPTAQSASRAPDGSLLYVLPHYRPDDDRFERPSYFLIATAPDALCSLYLTMSGARIEALPFVPDPDAMPYSNPAPLDAPFWLVNLCRLCEQAILPHVENLQRIPFFPGEMDKPNFTKLGCEQIIDDQIECFRHRRRAFFPSCDAWLQWECWSRVARWLTRQISPEEACKTIGIDLALYATLMEKTLASCRSELLASTLQSEDWVDVAAPVIPTVTQENSVVASVMQKYIDPSVLIGDPDLRFPTDPGCLWTPNLPESNKARKAEAARWWWRKLNSRDDCSDDLHELFFQNWARSAFLYEYRCRRNRSTERPWFGVPWVTLDHIQRAILRQLWPPEVAGPRTFVRPIVPALSDYGKLSRETLQIPVDLEKMSDAAILEQVQKILTSLRKARGFPAFKKGEGGVLTNYRWKVLEAMDEAFYKNQTLSGADRTGKSAVEKRYKAACEEAGIEL